MGSYTMETDNQQQDALLWTNLRPDMYGKARTAVVQELKVRWEERVQLDQAVTSDSERVVATVYASVPLPIGSILWRGKKADFPNNATTKNLYTVLFTREIPDLKGRRVRYSAQLGKYSSTVPTLA